MMDGLAQLFTKSQGGNREAENALYRLASFRLRQIACALMQRERREHTLQPTALVSEFFLRARGVKWSVQNDEDLFHLSARVMKQVLVDHARHRQALKRMAPERLGELLTSSGRTDLNPDLRIAVNTALEELRGVDPLAASTVWQRCVEGMTLDELSRLQRREVWRVRADCDFGLQWMAGRLGSATY
jgi:RNA polymerase sigma factor (TIGR02999 family)